MAPFDLNVCYLGLSRNSDLPACQGESHLDDVRRVLTLGLSFSLAFTAGWCGLRGKFNASAPKIQSEVRNRDGRGHATPLTAATLIQKYKKVKPEGKIRSKEDLDAINRRWAEENERFEKLNASFVLGDNPAAQYAEALKLLRSDGKSWVEMKVLVLHWLRQDADGFIAFYESLPAEDRGNSGVWFGFSAWTSELPLEKNIELLEKSRFPQNQSFDALIVQQIVKQSLESGHFEDGISMMERIPQQNRQLFKNLLASECPANLTEQAFKWFVDHGDIQLLVSLSVMSVPIEGTEKKTWNLSWVSEMIAKHPETKEALIKNGFYQKIMMSEWNSLPLEQRIDEMAAGSPFTGSTQEKRKKAIEYCCNRVANELIGEGSLSTEMATENIKTEAELVQKLGPEAKALYADYPDALRKAIFPYWALNDPEAALQATSQLSPQEREQLVVHAASRDIVNQAGDAERLYRLFQAFPPKKEQGPLQARFNCWGYVSRKAYAEYGDSYVEWLRALPNNVDRDMAMAALAQTIKGTDPDLSARLVKEKNNPGGGR